MNSLERIAVLNNEVEAERLDTELEAQGIPHQMVCYHDSAYDGVFQAGHGWGRVEAEAQHRDEILSVLAAIRQVAPETQGSAPAGERKTIMAEEPTNQELLESIQSLAQIIKWSAAAAVCLSAAILICLILRLGVPFSTPASTREWTWSGVRRSMDAGDFQTAIQAGNWLAQRSPEYAYGHAVLASAYASAGELTNALRQAERAYDLLPTKDNENFLDALEKRVGVARPPK